LPHADILTSLEVRSDDDQRKIRSFAPDIFVTETEVVNQTLVTQSLTSDLICSCGARVKHGLPCSHYLNARIDRRPMLSLEDVPTRWRREHISQERVASYTVTRMPSDGRLPGGQYSFANLSARFEPYLSAATRDPIPREYIDDCLRQCEGLRTQMSQSSAESGGMSAVPALGDPLIVPIAGRRNVHPSGRSPFAHRMSSRDKSPGKPKKRIVHRCSLCK
jgi:hypothetical protein